MKYIDGYKTLGSYLNNYPFHHAKIETVNIVMDADDSILISVSRPKIWHMNIVNAINDHDERCFRSRINTFDQRLIRVSRTKNENGGQMLNLYIAEYKHSPMSISSEGFSK